MKLIKLTVGALLFFASTAFGYDLPQPNIQAEKQKALDNAKNKAAEKVNTAASKASEFHVGPPTSDTLAGLAKEKNQGPNGSTAVGKFIADCVKKAGEKSFDCIIKPEIEVRQQK